ncbi:hypothetical protein BaRGS_00031200 [Batillaria attramentaria]|uniref:Peptidase M14 domain-containing protein n=1 Tax=Batillaria attramentaria TaxID=370345 RepID=A0ABD0JR33_9CAEN
MGHVTWFSTWALLVLIIVTTVRASHLPLGERDILDGDALRNVINHLTTDYNADVLFGGTNVAEVIVTSADYDDVVNVRGRNGSGLPAFEGHTEMTNVLATVTKQAKDADVTLSSMGRSFEGRDMPFVELALNPDDDDEVEDMLEIPRTACGARPGPDKHMNGTGCVGVDANRNFGFDWNPVSGASSDPCSSVFAGPAPFSEPETQNIRDWLDDLSDRAVMFVTMHAFGQFVLHPPRFQSQQNYGQRGCRGKSDVSSRIVGLARIFDLIQGLGAPWTTRGEGPQSRCPTRSSCLPVSTLRSSRTTIFALGFLYPEEKLPDTVDATWNGFKAMARAIYDEAAEDDEEEDRRDV